MTQFWFVISIIFILMELLNPGLFFFLALALGALATLFANLYDCLQMNEYAYFFTVSGIMLGFLHLLVRWMQKQKNSKSYQSNTHLLIGKTIEITEVIADDIGYGKLDGEIWQVRLHNKNQQRVSLKVGMHGLVVSIKGCHLQVTIIE